MLAVDAIVDHLKAMSKKVTTPEEIAQVNTGSSLKLTKIHLTIKA